MKNYHIGCGYTIGKSWLNYDSSPIAFFDQRPILNQIIRINKSKFPKGIIYGNIVKKNFVIITPPIIFIVLTFLSIFHI